jgi:hypothetical protein
MDLGKAVWCDDIIWNTCASINHGKAWVSLDGGWRRHASQLPGFDEETGVALFFFFMYQEFVLDPFVLYLVDVWSGPLLLAFQFMNCNMNSTAVWDTSLWSAWGLAAMQQLLSVLLSALFFGAFSGGTYQKSHCTSKIAL